MDYDSANVALAGLAGNVASSAISAVASAELDDKTRKFNKEQAQVAREWQEKMWNAANEYNSPLSTMQRLTEAGLNPNLVYGSGSGTYTAASVPSTEKASSSPHAKFENMQLGNMLVNAYLQNEQLKRQNALAEAQVKTEEAKQYELDTQASKNIADANYTMTAKQYLGAEKTEDIRRKSLENTFFKDVYSLRVESEDLKRDLLYFSWNKAQLLNKNVDTIVSKELEQLFYQVALLDKQERLYIAQTLTEGAKQTQLYANADNLRAYARYILDKNEREGTLNDKQVEYYESLVKKNDQEIYNMQVNAFEALLKGDYEYFNTLVNLSGGNSGITGVFGIIGRGIDSVLNPSRYRYSPSSNFDPADYSPNH